MKRGVWVYGLLGIFVQAFGQINQPGLVQEYNGEAARSPLPGVQLTLPDAGSAVSDSKGKFVLRFQILQPGANVHCIEENIYKKGYVVFNKEGMEHWRVSNDGTPFLLIMCKEGTFNALKRLYYGLAQDSYTQKYKLAMELLKKQRAANRLTKAQYEQKLQEENEFYQRELAHLSEYAEKFARIDESEIKGVEKEAVKYVKKGDIRQAIRLYETLDLLALFEKQIEKKEWIEKELVDREKELATLASDRTEIIRKMKMEVNLLKLEGGRENFEEAGRLLKKIALADTTDVTNVYEYANFAFNQGDYADAKVFYTYLASSGYKHYHLFACKGLGNIESRKKNYREAIGYYRSAMNDCLEYIEKGEKQYTPFLIGILHNIGATQQTLHDYEGALQTLLEIEDMEHQIAYESKTLARIENTLGTLYSDLKRWPDAEKSYKAALAIYSKISTEVGEVNLHKADVYNNLGILYRNKKQYRQAEEAYQEAIRCWRNEVEKNPLQYTSLLSSGLFNLGVLHCDMQQYESAEKEFEESLRLKQVLAANNPMTYQYETAQSYNNLGNVYDALKSSKAEKYYLKALHLFLDINKTHEGLYRSDLAMIYNNLGVLYYSRNEVQKADSAYQSSIRYYKELAEENEEIYMSDYAMSLNNSAIMYLSVKEFDKAEENFQNALGVFEKLMKRKKEVYESDYYRSMVLLGYALTSDGTNMEEGKAVIAEAYAWALRQHENEVAVIIRNLYKAVMGENEDK